MVCLSFGRLSDPILPSLSEIEYKRDTSFIGSSSTPLTRQQAATAPLGAHRGCVWNRSRYPVPSHMQRTSELALLDRRCTKGRPVEFCLGRWDGGRASGHSCRVGTQHEFLTSCHHEEYCTERSNRRDVSDRASGTDGRLEVERDGRSDEFSRQTLWHSAGSFRYCPSMLTCKGTQHNHHTPPVYGHGSYRGSWKHWLTDDWKSTW